MAVRVLTAEPVLRAGAHLAEGPRWDARTGRLLWVDILAGQVHSLDPDTTQDRALDLGRQVGAVAPDGTAYGLVAAVRDGFVSIDPDGAQRSLDLVLVDRPEVRFNDGRADRAGRFWAGTMRYDLEPGHGALYRLDAGQPARPVWTGLGLTNGLDWSPDDRLFYLADTTARTVDVADFDLADGALTGRRRFLDLDPALGSPDGLTVDADGCVWVALYGGGRVHRYTPAGELDTVLEVPGATHVTSPGFGGAGLDVLFVTTALENIDPAQRADQPNAGAVLAVRPGVAGQPTAAFAG